MKKLIVIFLSTVLVLCLAACGGAGGSGGSESSEPQTIAEAMAIESESNMSGYDENHFVYIYYQDGKPMRAIADMTPEFYEAMGDIEFFDDQGDLSQELMTFMESLKISKLEDLSDQILPQEELDKLVGLTGAEILAQGYTIEGHEYTMENTKFSLAKDLFVYTGTFDGIIDESKYEDDETELIKDMVLTAIEFESVSYNATEVE